MYTLMNAYGSVSWGLEHQVVTHQFCQNTPMKLYSRHPQLPRWRPSGYVQRNLGRLRVSKMPTRTDGSISGAKFLTGFASNTHLVQFWLMVWYSIWKPGKPL